MSAIDGADGAWNRNVASTRVEGAAGSGAVVGFGPGEMAGVRHCPGDGRAALGDDDGGPTDVAGAVVAGPPHDVSEAQPSAKAASRSRIVGRGEYISTKP